MPRFEKALRDCPYEFEELTAECRVKRDPCGRKEISAQTGDWLVYALHLCLIGDKALWDDDAERARAHLNVERCPFIDLAVYVSLNATSERFDAQFFGFKKRDFARFDVLVPEPLPSRA